MSTTRMMQLGSLSIDATGAIHSFDLALPALNSKVQKAFQRRESLLAQDLAAQADTLGWDTTFAIRIPDVNVALRRSGAYPKDFDKVIDPAQNYKIQGTFGDWQIARGGDGGIVFMSIPIAIGTMTDGEKSYSLDGATVQVSVKLLYIPQRPSSQVKSAHPKVAESPALEIDDLVVDPVSRSEADPSVVVQTIVFSGTPPTIYIKALMVGALQEWFTANLARFAYVFATVNLNESAAQEQFQWIKPTYTSYAYFDGPADDTSYFGILCMTDSRSPEGLSRQLAPRAIPSGARAGFTISMERFLEKMILPGLAKGFPEATSASFTLKSGNQVIENTQEIQCDSIPVNGISYTPYIQNFTLQIVGTEIQVNTRTKIEISPGIRAWVECTSYQEIIVVDKPGGGQTFDFRQSREPITNHWVDKDSWVTITEIIIGIVGAVAAAVAGAVINGMVKVIVAVVLIAVVAGMAAATPTLIAQVAGGGAAENLPTIDLLVLNATAPVQWPDSKEFKLTSAGLNGSFQLGGDPHFESSEARIKKGSHNANL